MTFLDAIEAGLPFEKALSEGTPNLTNDLTKPVLEKLLKKKLSLKQIAQGFYVQESFVIMKCQEFGLELNGVAYQSFRRKMTILEGLKSGMKLEKALEVCGSPLPTEITPENTKWLFENGYKPIDVGRILNLWANEAVELYDAFTKQQTSSSPEDASEPKGKATKSLDEQNEFCHLSLDEKVAKVLPMVQQGKNSKEIHDFLGLKHPAALQFIRKAEKQLASKSTEPAEQVIISSVIEEEPLFATGTVADQMVNNIEIQWESDLFPNNAPLTDEIRLLSDSVSFSTQMLPSASAYEIGISKDLKHLAIRAISDRQGAKKGTTTTKGCRKRISAKGIVKLFQKQNLQPPLTFKIIEQSKERIVGELVS